MYHHVDAAAEPQSKPKFLQLRDCLEMLLDMLPSDISRQYVFEQCLSHQDVSSTPAICAAHVFDTFSRSSNYRKEAADSAALHLPQHSPTQSTVWSNTWTRYHDAHLYYFFVCNSLAAEFPMFAQAYIEFLFVLKGCLYLTYVTLYQQARMQLNTKSWTAPRVSLAFSGRCRGSPVADRGHAHAQRELAAAMRACHQDMLATVPAGHQISTAKVQDGQQNHSSENTVQHVQASTNNALVERASQAPSQNHSSEFLVECLCCFTDTPMNKMVSCSGQQLHQFCHNCMSNYVESLIGDMKCRPICFAVSSECQASISNQQLRHCLAPATLDLLLDRQVHQDLKDLNMDVAECPFCNYAEEIPTTLQARWFVCKNLKCAKTSCISCHELAHMPMSCDEAKASKRQDATLMQRHVLEEAMTAALMRKCNKCQLPFVKTEGCNSMTCPRAGCRNKQCYVCGQNVVDYGHFGKASCPMYDVGTVENRHVREVQLAQEAAILQIRQLHPSISTADLKGKQPLSSEPPSMQKTTSATALHATTTRRHVIQTTFEESRAANGWDAKRMVAVRNRLDGIPGSAAPVTAAVVQDHNTDEYSTWSHDLLQRFGYARQVIIQQAARENEQSQASSSSSDQVQHRPVQARGESAGPKNAMRKGEAGFATTAARSAMRPETASKLVQFCHSNHI